MATLEPNKAVDSPVLATLSGGATCSSVSVRLSFDFALDLALAGGMALQGGIWLLVEGGQAIQATLCYKTPKMDPFNLEGFAPFIQ